MELKMNKKTERELLKISKDCDISIWSLKYILARLEESKIVKIYELS